LLGGNDEAKLRQFQARDFAKRTVVVDVDALEFRFDEPDVNTILSLRYASGLGMNAFRSVFIAALAIPLAAQQTPSTPDSNSIFERTKAATVVILAGEGAGRLRSIATGVIISKNGVLLTALHSVKGAAEVQVRMANGEVFDSVELLGSDERRDVAALKISAGALPFLAPARTASLAQGDPVYAVTNAPDPTLRHRQE